MVIVQEEVPAYRKPFFGRLRETLAESDVELVVAAGQRREDSTTGALEEPWLVRVPMSTAERTGLTRLRVRDVMRRADLIVSEQALRHLETYGLLGRQALGGTPVALWGHGRTIVKPVSALERWALRQITNRAHWFFAYTERARTAVVRGGFPAHRVTVVQNAIDTEELAAARRSVGTVEAASLRKELGLPAKGVCLSLGSLVPAKRLGFLLDAAQVVAARRPEFALIVAGDGPEREFIERAARRHEWLRYAGAVDGTQKARLGSVSELLLVPGRVGLVAVDSFALQTPIVTTGSPFHAPEFEYLVDGANAVVTDDDVGAFAQAVERVLADDALSDALRRGCVAAARRYTLSAMVNNFTAGTLAALASASR